MAHVAGHLSVAALEARYEACEDAMSSRHFQTIWLLAKGHSTGEVAAMTSSASAGSNSWWSVTTRLDLRRWAICVGATARRRKF